VAKNVPADLAVSNGSLPPAPVTVRLSFKYGITFTCYQQTGEGQCGRAIVEGAVDGTGYQGAPRM